MSLDNKKFFLITFFLHKTKILHIFIFLGKKMLSHQKYIFKKSK